MSRISDLECGAVTRAEGNICVWQTERRPAGRRVVLFGSLCTIRDYFLTRFGVSKRCPTESPHRFCERRPTHTLTISEIASAWYFGQVFVSNILVKTTEHWKIDFSCLVVFPKTMVVLQRLDIFTNYWQRSCLVLDNIFFLNDTFELIGYNIKMNRY